MRPVELYSKSQAAQSNRIIEPLVEKIYLATSMFYLFTTILFVLTVIRSAAGQTFNVYIFAGTGSASPLVNGAGTTATFNKPYGLTVSAVDGSLFMADFANNYIRKITNTGQVSIYAGSGTLGFLDSSATSSMFSSPSGVALDSVGNLFVADSINNRIRKIDSSTKAVSTFAGAAASGVTNAVGVSARFNGPRSLCLDASDNIYVVDSGNHQIRKINSAQSVSIYAGAMTLLSGYVDGFATVARFNGPYGIAIDVSTTTLYVTENTGNRVRKIDSARSVTTIAGSVVGSADGIGTTATFSQPDGIAFDSSSGKLYVTDRAFSKIRTIIISTRTVGTLAGGSAGSIDGPNTVAQFSNPQAVVVDSASSVIVSDSNNNKLRRIVYCGPSTYWKASTQTCVTADCPAGQEFNYGTVSCQNCTLGYAKSLSGTQACFQCGLGTESAADFTSCSDCVQGYTYRPSLIQSTCQACPTNSFCNKTSFSCLPGFKYDSVSNTCPSCTANTYKDTVGNTDCSVCPVGKEYFNSTYCKVCDNGMYRSSTSMNMCVLCPSNATCLATGFSCNAGYKFDSNTNSCLLCDLGTFKSSSGTTQCSTCVVGTESSLDRISCVSCGSLKYRPTLSTSSCIDCPGFASCSPTDFSCLPGYEINGTSTGCSACPASLFKNSTGNSLCQQCSLGSEYVNQTYCVSCQSGYYRDQLASVQCQQCPANSNCDVTGFLCSPGFSYTLSNNSCTVCPLNFVKSSTSNSACSQCPVGTVSNNARTQCDSCGTGMYRSSLSMTSCLDCPANSDCFPSYFSCLPGFGYNSTTNSCEQCRVGTIKSTSANSLCTSCGIGTESNLQFTACTACASQKYRPSVAYDSCIGCPGNAICSATAFTCNAGYRNTGIGCEICPLGTQVDQAGTGCAACPSGKYRNSLNQIACASCPSNSDCTAFGYACSGSYSYNNADGTCIQCVTGFNKTLSGNFDCAQCPRGTEPDANRINCNNCAASFYKPSLDFTLCIPCTEGVSCSPTEFECIAGYESLSTPYRCATCLEGFFKPLPGNTACLACPASSFSNDNGTMCVDCALGYFKSTSTFKCERCLIGTESNTVRDGCKSCTAGYYRPSLDYNKCTTCPTGSVCSGADFKCKEGYWINASGKGCTNAKETISTNTTMGVPNYYIVIAATGAGTILALTIICLIYYNRKKSNYDGKDMKRLNRRISKVVAAREKAEKDIEKFGGEGDADTGNAWSMGGRRASVAPSQSDRRPSMARSEGRRPSVAPPEFFEAARASKGADPRRPSQSVNMGGMDVRRPSMAVSMSPSVQPPVYSVPQPVSEPYGGGRRKSLAALHEGARRASISPQAVGAVPNYYISQPGD